MTVSLTSLEVVLELIWHPTTKEGWTVRAVTEGQTSPSGLTVTDESLGLGSENAEVDVPHK